MATKEKDEKEKGGVLPLLFFGGLLASGIIYMVTRPKKPGDGWPPTAVIFPGQAYELSGEGADYFTIRDLPEGKVFANPQLYIGQNLNQIRRAAFIFDTSELINLMPPGAVINSAALSLFCFYDMTPGHQVMNLVITNGQPVYPHDPPLSSDFDRTLYSGAGGRLSTPLRGNQYNDILLYPEALDWIDPQGLTKLMVMCSRDIEGLVPTSIYEWVGFNTDKMGEDYVPRLIVVF